MRKGEHTRQEIIRKEAMNIQEATNDERLLMAQARSGSSSAFGELYERHRLKIYRTAFRILRNRQDAEAATQRSFQRAFTTSLDSAKTRPFQHG